jgi:uncharacterized heparinase superfamily protein
VSRRALLYWHTLRYLRARQIVARVWAKLPRSFPAIFPAPQTRQQSGAWILPARRHPSMTGPMTFRLLNEERRIDSAPWGANSPSALWRYNIHYFDDLNALGAENRRAWHGEALANWIRDNPPSRDEGWAPYPSSLRVVNWIKWCLRTGAADQHLVESLAVQVRCILVQLEYHLLGNHLFSNAKALVFAGLFYQGCEADSLLERGFSILARELPEQILRDGGHFERSTMYHALAYEDLLDLINVANAFSAAIPEKWQGFVASWPEIASRMGLWLRVMTHPDRDIAFFNDAAIGIAPAPAELDRYARNVGIEGMDYGPRGLLVHLPDSGYVKGEFPHAHLFIDVAPVGPDYLPGHAHADTLSFELSVYGERLIVNGGTSRYGLGKEREVERATPAHSTVTVDGFDSSEVWAGFRVARRANPLDLQVNSAPGAVEVACSHDGYRRLPGKPVHRRKWTLRASELHVEDRVDGRYGDAIARFHLHPTIACNVREDRSGEFQLQSGRKVAWQVIGGIVSLEESAYAPEFGRRIPTKCLAVKFKGSDPVCLSLAW